MARRSLVGVTRGDMQAVEYLGNKMYRCKCIKCGREQVLRSTQLKYRRSF